MDSGVLVNIDLGDLPRISCTYHAILEFVDSVVSLEFQKSWAGVALVALCVMAHKE